MSKIERINSHFPERPLPSTISGVGFRAIEVLIGIATLPVAGVASILVIALKVAKCVYKLFANKESVHLFSYKIRKFKLIFVDHLLNWSILNRRLVNTENIPQLSVIKNEEDTKAALKMREEFLKNNQLIPQEHTHRLRKASCYGATTEGICFGAVKSIIKACLNAKIESEEQLVEVISQFKRGFDAEASGLQLISDKTQPFLNVIKNKALSVIKDDYDELCRLENELEKKKTSQQEQKNLQALHLQKFKECRYKLRSLQAHDKFQYYNSLLELIGLRITDEPNKFNDTYFDFFHQDEIAQKRFDNVPNGIYSINFPTNNSGHSIAYLKFSFGSYFIDPSLGLLKLTSIPSQKLLTLLEYHYSPNYNFELHTHQLKN